MNPVALGYHVKALIHLEVPPEEKSVFYTFVRACPNVIECNCVTGDYSMVLEVLFPAPWNWISLSENCSDSAEQRR